MNRSDEYLLSTTQQIYLGLGLISSCLSLIGCTLIISIFLTFKSLRTTGRKILVYLSIANAGVCVGNFLASGGVVEYGQPSWHWYALCAWAGSISIIFRISSYLWTSALGVYLYMSLSWKRMSMAGKLLIPFHIICWMFPVAIMAATLASRAIGFTKGVTSEDIHPPYCLVDVTAKNFITWSFVSGMGWEVGAMVICILSYLFIQLAVIKQGRSQKSAHDSTEELTLTIHTANLNLRHVLILFIIISVPGIWHFLATLYKPSPDWLVFLAVIGDNSQGFVNAILFCLLTKKVRKKLCGKICSKLQKLCKQKAVQRTADLAGLRMGPEGENLVEMQDLEWWDESAPDDNVLWQKKKQEKEIYC